MASACSQNPDVAVLNMAAVLTQVRDDAVCAVGLSDQAGVDRVGILSFPLLAERVPHDRYSRPASCCALPAPARARSAAMLSAKAFKRATR